MKEFKFVTLRDKPEIEDTAAGPMSRFSTS